VIAAAPRESDDDEKQNCEADDNSHESTSWIFRGQFRGASRVDEFALATSISSEADASELFF
jgi:hypothetical protein